MRISTLLKAALWVSPALAQLPNCVYYENFTWKMHGQQSKAGMDPDCWAFKTDIDRCFGNVGGAIRPALNAGISNTCSNCVTEKSSHGPDYFAFSCDCEDSNGNVAKSHLDMASYIGYSHFYLSVTDEGQAHFVCEVNTDVEIMNAYTDPQCLTYQPSNCPSSPWA